MRWRALLSALAGGGITVAGLGGPLAGGALGAEGPAGTTTTGESAAPPATSTTSTTPTTGTTTTGSGTSSTSTSTTPATTSSPAPTTTPAPSTETTPTVAPTAEGSTPPTVVVRHKQQATPGKPANPNTTQTKVKPTSAGSANGAATSSGSPSSAANAPNNVATPPQLVAAQADALAAMLAGSAASAQALDFYRIPLFLLPIYQAAAVQYDVPWQILAAINEIETDYGTDLSVSSAGAEGWMQFEPSTWLQYGVDALNAGYADPYNPVDAIFAAARYLNAAGAAHDLNAAILAYNHSEEYVESVLLRAKLIAAYPDQVIATLTGLIDGRPPVTGARIGWSAPVSAATASPPSPSSATAGASAVSPSVSGTEATAPSSPDATAAAATTTPGSSAAPAPASAATSASTKAGALQFVDVTSEPHAKAVAVQSGRILELGSSRKLGRYVVLQDVYGDVFTYAGLGSIARSYTPPEAQAAINASAHASRASTQGRSAAALPTGSEALRGESGGESTSASTGTGKIRVFAHPDNPDARAAIRAHKAAGTSAGGGRQSLRSGSIVTEGTVLGHVGNPPGATDGHLRFAIRPAGDSSTIDPRAILSNWTQLDAALHPQGAQGNPSLLGATASDVFLLSKSQLERAVLSDPGIALSACSRHEVASGAIDKRELAVLAFLSRSGLKPTVGTLRCGAYAAEGYVAAGHGGDAVAIVAINGVPIAGHQGAGSITDTTIRTLLTLQGQFSPARIVSLMHYPGAPSTLARADHGDYIEVVFAPAPAHAHAVKSGTTAAAHSAASGTTAPAPTAIVGELSSTQWEQLFARIAALPAPNIAVKPSSAAIPDHPASASSPQAASSNHGPGSGSSPSGGG
jgi:membrane-bound lytic murein transglycosylase B